MRLERIWDNTVMMMKSSKTSASLVAFLISLTIGIVGCGGGTTGTSSTDELRVKGYAEAASGERLGDVPMVVRSGVGDQELLASQTDQKGDFDMSLPGEEDSIVIEVGGKDSPEVRRNFSGSSVMSTVLAVDTAGAPSASETFEVQIDAASLCDSLISKGNTLYIIQEPVGQSCSISLATYSDQESLTPLRGEFIARCDGQPQTFATSLANQAGEIRLDVPWSRVTGCESIEIVVFPSAQRSRTVSISVE